MDSDSDARPTAQVSSEPTLTAYREGATDIPAASQSFASSPVTWTSRPHLDPRSRDNLRQASVALDTAYERINSLRTSINNMLNRIPPEVAGTGTLSTSNTDTNDPPHRRSPRDDADIRPPHSALVLSGEQAVEELNVRAARLRSLIPPSARQRLEEFESNSRSSTRRESAWDRLSQTDHLPRLRTPPMPDLVLPRARDLVDPRAAQRRDLQSVNLDESSTMIGQRVAARVSLNASEGQGSLSSRMSLQQIEQRLRAQTAQVARELENMTERLAASRSRRVELASRTRGGSATTNAQENGTPQVGSAAASVDARAVPNPPVGGRPLRPARNVTVVDTTRIVLPQQISRTSSDGTPIEDSAHAHRSFSATFGDPMAAYRDRWFVDTSQDTLRNLANTPEVRGTLVNLLAREREEQPSTEASRREVSGRSGRRRRGWTRLNADGDEIDSDTEDNNVSPRTRRLRMRFSYGTPSVDQPVPIEEILWRPSGSDSEVDAPSPDATERAMSPLQGSPPRTPLRCPHPLPTPAEEMLVYPCAKPAQRPQVICVSKRASLAGR